MTFTGPWSPRTAFVIFASLFVFVRILFPYTQFNSDVANFGYMGNDIIKYGYLPTIAYGQNYLFSITPYVYALFRVIAPSSVSDVFVLTAAGGSLSLLGYWMVYESFLLAMRADGKEAAIPGAMFLAFLALSPNYYFDMMENSGLEIAVFTLGAMALTATRVDAGLRLDGKARTAPMILFGLTWAYAAYARPQMTVYGAAFFIALAVMGWKSGRWPMIGRLSLLTAVGAAVGYIPMALHKIFRASHWPFTLQSDFRFGNLEEIQDRIWLFSHRIFRDIMTLGWEDQYFSAVMIAISVTAVALYVIGAIRWRGQTPLVATGLFWGSLVIIVAMILIPGLSWNAGMRRYCLHAYIAFGFIFAYASAHRSGTSRAVMTVVVALAVALAVPVWSKSVVPAAKWNDDVIDAKAMIPVFSSKGKVVMADYWDAYLLGFMAEGKLEIEVFPWQLVRRYGAIPEDTMRRGSVWVIREGLGGTAFAMIEKDLGKQKLKAEIFIPLLGKKHAYVEFADPAVSAELMKKTRPEYFSVKYPPGS